MHPEDDTAPPNAGETRSWWIRTAWESENTFCICLKGGGEVPFLTINMVITRLSFLSFVTLSRPDMNQKDVGECGVKRWCIHSI